MNSHAFLTTFTGEPYQPVRLVYRITDFGKLYHLLNNLNCLEFSADKRHGQWQNKGEAEYLPFFVAESSDRQPHLNLGTLVLHGEKTMIIDLDSVQKAQAALLFFDEQLSSKFTYLHHIDFSNILTSKDNGPYQNYHKLFNSYILEKYLKEKWANIFPLSIGMILIAHCVA